ncbi:hypothetical protein BHE74_00020919 [Ensete ventricosum]|nr:hypothetical protein BHE74_00020919 [Ensete ventricosum]
MRVEIQVIIVGWEQGGIGGGILGLRDGHGSRCGDQPTGHKTTRGFSDLTHVGVVVLDCSATAGRQLHHHSVLPVQPWFSPFNGWLAGNGTVGVVSEGGRGSAEV